MLQFVSVRLLMIKLGSTAEGYAAGKAEETCLFMMIAYLHRSAWG